MQQVQISDKGAIVCYMYFNLYYLATAPISKYPLHQSTHTFVLTTFLCCWGRLWFFKIDFFFCNNTKPYENKIKSFQKFYIFAIQGSQDTCSYVQIKILVINSALFCFYMYYTYFSWEAIWEDKQFLMIPYLIGRKLD